MCGQPPSSVPEQLLLPLGGECALEWSLDRGETALQAYGRTRACLRPLLALVCCNACQAAEGATIIALDERRKLRQRAATGRL